MRRLATFMVLATPLFAQHRHIGKPIQVGDQPNVLYDAGDSVHSLYFLSRDKRMPDIDRILGTKPAKSFQVETKDFISALRRTLNFSRSEKDTVAGVIFGSKDKSLSLSFSAQDCDSEEFLETDLGGNAPSFKVNGDYLLSFAGEVWNKSIEFHYNGNRDPIHLKPADADYPMMITALIDPRM